MNLLYPPLLLTQGWAHSRDTVNTCCNQDGRQAIFERQGGAMAKYTGAKSDCVDWFKCSFLSHISCVTSSKLLKGSVL